LRAADRLFLVLAARQGLGDVGEGDEHRSFIARDGANRKLIMKGSSAAAFATALNLGSVPEETQAQQRFAAAPIGSARSIASPEPLTGPSGGI
jgi:hypothetical protein